MKYIENSIVVDFTERFQCKRIGYIGAIELGELSYEEKQRVKELVSQYGFDEIITVSDGSKVFAVIMVFKFRNIELYVLDIWKKKIVSCLEIFGTRNSLIVSKNVLSKIFEGQLSIACVISHQIKMLTKNCTKDRNIVTLEFLEHFKIGLQYDKKITENQILKYFSIYPRVLYNNGEKSDFQIICTENGDDFKVVYEIYGFIDYLFKMRFLYKPELVSAGSGYTFYKISNLIIGIQKFSNYADSDYIYYIINLQNRECRIFSKSNALQHGFRSCNAFVAYLNQKEEGLNLHSSMLSYKGHGILLMGRKKAGKTTNMLYGLLSNKEMAFCSNDYVHLKKKEGKWYGYGSWKKVTIREDTVRLFPELRKMRGSQYDSKGDCLEKSEKVCSVDELVKVFKRKINVSSAISVMILLKYSDDISVMSINKMKGNEIYKEVSKNMHDYFNGNEKFWNDILQDTTERNHYIDEHNIDAYYVVIGSENSFELWEKIKKIVDDKF